MEQDSVTYEELVGMISCIEGSHRARPEDLADYIRCESNGLLEKVREHFTYFNKPPTVTDIVSHMANLEFYMEALRQELHITRREVMASSSNALLKAYAEELKLPLLMNSCIPKMKPTRKTMKLKVKKLVPEAMLPRYASEGAACFDIHACIPPEHGEFGVTRVTMNIISAQKSTEVPTGLAFEIPEGYAMLIYSRSGHGFKNGVRLSNCVGVIDSDYRGEVMVSLTNDNAFGRSFSVLHGDRIAQAMMVPVPKVEFEEVAELSTTERGTGGFGSTGSQGELFNKEGKDNE